MKAGAKVRLTKMEGDVAPLSYEARVNPNIGYAMVGFLITDLAVGQPIEATRIERNGIKALGVFSSSPVTSIEGDNIRTRNSVWKIEIIP
jgi:hypothetical protein